MSTKTQIPSKLPGFLCPACAYDLRGSESKTCPECGHPFTVSEVRARRANTWKHEGLYQRLSFIPIAWLAIYLLGPRQIAETGSRFVPESLSGWIASIIFLSIPIQLAAGILGFKLVRSKSRSIKQGGAVLVAISLILMVGHLIITGVSLL